MLVLSCSGPQEVEHLRSHQVGWSGGGLCQGSLSGLKVAPQVTQAHTQGAPGPMATQHRDIKQGGLTSLRLGRLLPTGWRLAPQAVRQPASCRRGDRLCCGLSRAHQIPAPSLGHCRSPHPGGRPALSFRRRYGA